MFLFLLEWYNFIILLEVFLDGLLMIDLFLLEIDNWKKLEMFLDFVEGDFWKFDNEIFNKVKWNGFFILISLLNNCR